MSLKIIAGENVVKLGDGNVSDFQKKKASAALAKVFPTVDEKDKTHVMMMEMEPLLIASGYWTWRNILLTHGE